MNNITLAEKFALSPTQQGMLFHSLHEAHTGANIEQIVSRLSEPLVPARWEKSWLRTVERHACLRTSFHFEGRAEPEQEVHTEVRLPFLFEDWRSAEDPEKALEAFLQDDRERGFAMDQAPLSRVALFRLGDERFVCVWTFHHILLDGRSFADVLKDVFAAYEASESGASLPVSSYPSYSEYIDWRGRLDKQRAEVFWRERLKGFTAATPFVVDRSHATQASSSRRGFGTAEARLTRETTAELSRFAADRNLTLNTLVQGCWATLLSRYSGETDVVFGAVRACRKSSIPNADQVVGLFINTLPVRARITADRPLVESLQELRRSERAVRDYEHTPLVEVQGWSEVGRGKPLFESLIVFDYQDLHTELRSLGGAWERRSFELIEQTNYPLNLYAYAEPALSLKIRFDPARFEKETVDRMVGHLRTLLESLPSHPEAKPGALPLLTDQEKRRLLTEWNQTETEYSGQKRIFDDIEEQARRNPDATALVFEDQELSYRELDERSNQVANRLAAMGVGPGVLAGVFMQRSAEMVVALMGILKAGGAYVPLDPGYPRDRIAGMVEDSKVAVLVTQPWLLDELPPHEAQVLALDPTLQGVASESRMSPRPAVVPADLAYVIYTSGSTGKPKGVMVAHGNVVNFFVGMDACIPYDPDKPGVWLAVTSISFDISVLELFWTLSRGFKVVLQADEEGATSAPADGGRAAARDMAFSLMYFAADESVEQDKYRLLFEGAKFADRNGFSAVWTPERHFHAFGGLYPNPSVMSAALAIATENVQLRAGSVVLPLHNPIRIAEEWSVVDNLSNGRVALSIAAGWHPNDFVLARDNYKERKDIMLRDAETIRRLWRGESVTMKGGVGQDVEVKVLPRPVQQEIPMWMTAAGNPETFRLAGEQGFSILTHLLGQTVEEVAEKIRIYRQAWDDAGHDPKGGVVTLMLHTYIGEDVDEVREKVRVPFSNYLKTSLNLVKMAPGSFPAFRRPSEQRAKAQGLDVSADDFTEEDVEALLEHAFDRYFETSGLFGTPSSCVKMVRNLSELGVDEIACLVDFGVEVDSVLSSLEDLQRLRTNYAVAPKRRGFTPFAELVAKHEVTHLQCTPSMAKMLLGSPDTMGAFESIPTLLLGGEALPQALAESLGRRPNGTLLNMYGPTETTIWSTVCPIDGADGKVSIGRPIANTQIYILDDDGEPVPIGVAGQLFIGGDGVVPGYLHREQLTAERFVSDPFRHGDARMYATGDLARYLPGGDIDFIGRSDHQVKLRGYRIELGEIEAVLEKMPGVREAVALVREDAPGEQRLVGYVTSANGEAPSVSTLREGLKRSLPDFMVPAAFVTMDAFPLTPNGKINRRILPAPDSDRPDLNQRFEAPTTAAEKALARVWGDVLGLDEVGVHDNFFDLGGDSILAVQIVAKSTQSNLRLTVRELLEHQTIAELAPRIAGVEAVKAEQGAVSGDAVVTPIQHWFLDQDLPEAHHYNQTMLLTAPAALDPGVMAKAVEAIVAHHDALRARFVREASGWKQAYAPAETETPFAVVDLTGAPDEDRATRLQESIAEVQASLDLSAGPIVRVVHYDYGTDQPGRLLLAVHHLSMDGISWRIVLEDLQTAYQQLEEGRPLQLPAKTTSFPSWSQQLALHANSPTAKAELDYWTAQFPRSVPPIPVDFASGQNTEASAETYVSELSADETKQLLQDVPAAYSTQINDVLLTALAQSVSGWSASRQVLVDLEGHGREEILEDADISRTVGWFTSLFPVTFEVSAELDPGSALKSVKEQLRRIPRRGIGYGLLRHLCDDPEVKMALDGAPSPQIQFNYLGQFQQVFQSMPMFDPAAEPPGAFARVASPKQPRPYLLEILGLISDDRLKMLWHYSRNLHRGDSVEALAEAYMTKLRGLITHCCDKSGREFTPSDFPLANLNQEKLKKLAARLQGR